VLDSIVVGFIVGNALCSIAPQRSSIAVSQLETTKVNTIVHLKVVLHGSENSPKQDPQVLPDY